jgi:hypothetical protein
MFAQEKEADTVLFTKRVEIIQLSELRLSNAVPSTVAVPPEFRKTSIGLL